MECLDDKNSIKQAEQCIEDCGQVMHLAMNTLQSEITAFQVSNKYYQGTYNSANISDDC